ncbi:MAG TPA: hypothetical protein VGP04_06665 [Pseudonocardiaceae bacterium]|nr:hypothetical protein [Pseudonocardiaceae bacterium]
MFTKLLAGEKITLGAALVLPVVPTAVAAVGLAAFSTGLLGVYLPTPPCAATAACGPPRMALPWPKHVWMLGIAAGMSSTNSPATDDQL